MDAGQYARNGDFNSHSTVVGGFRGRIAESARNRQRIVGMDDETNKRLGELIMELANGNCLVLEEISLLLERILFAVGNTYFQNRADVEDAIHDLYLSLVYKAPRFTSNKNACAWVMTIYRNLIKTRLRKWQREERFARENGNVFGALSVDEKYIENHLFLKQIFGALTKTEQDLVIYYHWCKCSADETARILHMGRSTVYKKLAKLEEKVKKL